MNRSVGKRTHDLSGRLVAFGRYRGRGRDVLAHDIPPVRVAQILLRVPACAGTGLLLQLVGATRSR